MKGRKILFFFLLSSLSLSLLSAGDTEVGADDALLSDPGSGRESISKGNITSTAHAVNVLLKSSDSPAECITPFIFSMIDDPSSRNSLPNNALRFLEKRPSWKDEIVQRTAEGNFLIHYTKDKNTIDVIPLSDNDRNGIPDYVETIGQGLEEARRLFIETLGFHNPSARFSPGQPYEVYVVNLGGSVTGATIPQMSEKIPGTDQMPSFMLIDSMILDDATILKASAAHQFAHAITLAYTYKKEPWWSEATAIWLEDRLFHTLPRYGDALGFRLKNKGKALNAENFRLTQGNALWAFFLGEKDVSLIRKTWEEMELFPENSLIESFAAVLEREGYGSLQNNFSDYAIWNYFTGSKNDGNHFLFADILPDPVFDSSHATYPAVAVQSENPVESFGASFVRLESERTRGAVIVNFDGDQSCHWEVDMLLVSDAQPRYFRSKMTVSPSGHGSIGIPWQKISEVIMIVKNLSCEERSAGKFSFTASCDPSYPFELSFFTAMVEEGNISLQWETASETSLFGWNIYRSTEPEHNFSRINEIIIPALGDPSNSIIYKFLDDSVRQSVKYYYYIEGITLEGLTCQTPVSSANIKE